MKAFLQLSSLFIFLLLNIICSAQLVNQGATITILSEASLYAKMDVNNNSAGLITINGILEIQGDLINNATIATTSGSLLKFSGTSNSNCKSNKDIIENLELAKEGDPDAGLSLLDSLLINTNLNFVTSPTANKLKLGDNDLILMQYSTSVTGTDAQNYIAADGNGMFEKPIFEDDDYDFAIGDVNDYSFFTIHTIGSNYTSAKLRINLKPLVHPNKPSNAESYLKRYWTVEQVGISNYSALWWAQYIPEDVAAGSTESLIKGASYDGVEWNYENAIHVTNIVAGKAVASSADLTGTNLFGKLSLKLFLQGTYNNNLGEMTTTLPNLAVFPLTSPYSADPITISSIPPDVTDWVLIELRDPTSPTTILSSHAAFLKKDGAVIALDGNATPKLKDITSTNAIVSIRHRNHLPIRSTTGLDLINPVLHDFSSNLAQAYQNSALTNAAMVDLGGGIYGLFRGNVNADNTLNGLDFGLTKLNSNPPAVSVYSYFDINGDGNVNGLDFGLSKISTNPPKNAHL